MFAVVLTDPPGVGKPAVLTALADSLSDDGMPHAAIDVDALVWADPSPSAEQRSRLLATRFETVQTIPLPGRR